MNKKSEHSGHRQRMKKRFIDYGGETFETHEVLEMLLYYIFPRVDTNPIAHKLLDHFGSLANLIDAPFNALLDAGMTENTAAFIKLLPEVFSRYSYERFLCDNKVLTETAVKDMMITKYIGKNTESVYLLLLSPAKQMVFSNFITHGTNTHVDIDVIKICDYALRYKARYAFIAHNHPSGVMLPSKADIIATARLNEALSLIEVELLNHFIVSGNSVLGLKDVKSLFKSVADYEKSGLDTVYEKN